MHQLHLGGATKPVISILVQAHRTISHIFVRMLQVSSEISQPFPGSMHAQLQKPDGVKMCSICTQQGLLKHCACWL